MTGGIHDDDDDPLARAGVPSPDDRLWRHPSEVAATRAAAPPRRRQHPWILAGLGGAFGAGLTAGVLALTGAFTPDVVESTVIREEAVPVSMSFPDPEPAIAIADRTAASLARIEVTVGESFITGSAVVYDQDGHLLTNAHVVDGATSVVAVLNGEQRQTAEVVGVDVTTDLAVLRLPDGGGLTPVRLRADTPAEVGEQTIAMGSPLGLAGAPSVSTGIVSGHRSRIETTDGKLLYGLIQTDADIAAGSSGGALFDSDGLLLGITTAVVAEGGSGGALSFAIPADQVLRVVNELITSGQVTHAWMGVEGDAGASQPARVVQVAASGPAASSGLAEEDVITTVDGEPTPSMADVILLIRSRHPGEEIEIEYVRDGHRRNCRVVLAERPA